MSEHFTKWFDFLLIIALLIIAGFVRFEFQANSVVTHPIMKDAAVYFAIAQNLSLHGVYSSQKSDSQNLPPQTDFLRPPGYPLFLYLILSTSKDLRDFLTDATMFQAVLSSIGVLLIFGICRHFLAPGYAFGAGLLTALSPHLIAIDKYLLSESLFIFCMILAVLALVAAVKRKKNGLFLVSGMLFGFLALIRPVALLMGPFLAFSLALYLWRKWLPRQWLAMVLLMVTGYTLVYAPYLVIRNAAAKNFSVSGQTLWDKVVIGSDIGLKNFILNKRVPERKVYTAKMYSDKAYAAQQLFKRFKQDPMGHLKWYLYGKSIFLWQWDNIYMGDVYQYPMAKKGFKVRPVLKSIHTLMHWLHWPLFGLTLWAMLLIIGERLSGKGNLTDSHAVAVPMLVLVYFAAIFMFLVPLPRYGIPLRPFSYILAVVAVKTALEKILRKSHGDHSV